MESALWSAQEWAEQEFGDADLGDARLTKRAVGIAARLACVPGGTLPDPIPEWSQLKAAYRFLHNPRVNFHALARPFWEQTRQACETRGTYLLIEDTTVLDYTSHAATVGLGHVGNGGGRGFLLHNNLAVRVEKWDGESQLALNVMGLFGQEIWGRFGPRKEGRHEWRKRQARPRESERWGRALTETNGPPPGTNWIYIADRESDVMEVFLRCAERGVDWVIRATCNRKVEEDIRCLFDAAANAPGRGEFSLYLRARPGQPARDAHLIVRSRPIVVKGPPRPGGRLPDQEMWVVDVQELDAPAGVEPIHWVLLSSLNAETFSRCRKIVAYYASRWLIEEYHKALKSGTQVEKSQLETAEALENLIAIHSVVAVRLLALKEMAAAEPEMKVSDKMFGPEVWAVLNGKFGRPEGGWTIQSALVAVARLGGFLARKGDGRPGWLTIWRGWRRLILLVEGYLLAEAGR
jgi:hypothetical protein